MAPRAYWKGYLKLFLVSCPVRLYSATGSTTRVSFHMLHKDTHNRVQMKPHDPELGPVERSDLVKGYEFEKDRYVVVNDNELEQIQVEASKTITISSFVEAAQIGTIYYDTPYYVAPDGAVADETFRVIREAMRRKKRVAMARVVLSSRERLVALSPYDKGIMMSTLRTADEVRDAAPYFEEIGEGPLDQEMIELAEQIIEQKTTAFDPTLLEDRYQAALAQLIQAKIRGEKPVVARTAEPAKVIDLMEALRKSLGDAGSRKPPVKGRAAAPARKASKPKSARRRSA